MDFDITKVGEGYVTYLAAGGLVLIGLYVTFTKDLTTGMAIITAGIGLAGQRRAVANVQTGVTATVKAQASAPCDCSPRVFGKV